ncbi:MAG TPA: hypothetical protein VMW87_12160 [Spirochaetia bacterium]|nr:hypothetical protein [Spirochaetia bacterium]
MKKILVAPLLLLLASCVSIDTTVQLSANGSGQIALTYTVSQMVANLGTVDKEWQKLPLPIREADFRQTVASIPGLALTSYSQTEDSQNITIKASLAFTDLKALNQLYSPGSEGVTLNQTGGTTVYRQVIFQGFPDGIDQQSKDFAAAFFKDYHLNFTLATPAPIKNASAGTISADKRHVSYDIPILQLLDAKTPIVWVVTW